MKKLTCPKCNHEIDIEKHLAKDYEEKLTALLDKEKKSMEQALKTAKLELEKEYTREKEKIKQDIDEEVSKRLAEQANTLKQQMENDFLNQYNIQLQTLKKQNEDLVRQINDLNQKSLQTSQERQGEVVELSVTDNQLRYYPRDTLVEIEKGQNGADLVQVVKDDNGNEAGKIVLEIKNTKNFQQKWIEKAKHDQERVGGDMVIIVSRTLPADINNFDYRKGVWICDYNSFNQLFRLFRDKLIDMATLKNTKFNRSGKLEMIFQYINSHTFKEQLEMITSLSEGMLTDLATEKRSMIKHWNKREKQLELLEAQANAIWSNLSAILNIKNNDFIDVEDDIKELEAKQQQIETNVQIFNNIKQGKPVFNRVRHEKELKETTEELNKHKNDLEDLID